MEDAICPHCGSENCYGISRVVGYYSIIDNWNLGKQGEFKDRQSGDYILKDKIVIAKLKRISKKGD